MTTTFSDHILGPDTHANRPAATTVPVGTVYSCTDHDILYHSDGATWSDYLVPVAGLDATIFDAKGDIIAASAADTAAKVTVGANGTVLTADSSATAGVAWASAHKFVPEAPTALINVTGQTTGVSAVLLASGAPDGAVAVVLNLWMNCESGTNDTGNLLGVYHAGIVNLAALVRPQGTVTYWNHTQCTVGLNSSEQFGYSVTRVNGTLGWRIYRVGYWI